MTLLRLCLCLLASVPALAAPEPREFLRAGLGGARLEAVDTFSYRLTVSDPATNRVVRDARYRLEAATGALDCENLLTGERSHWDGRAGWLLQGADRHPLPAAAAESLREHVAYHFVRLLRDPDTRIAAVGPNRYRLTPAGSDPFEVVVDPGTGRILENHFGSDTIVHEQDYQQLEGVAWPMTFELRRNGITTRRGQFTEVAPTFRH